MDSADPRVSIAYPIADCILRRHPPESMAFFTPMKTTLPLTDPRHLMPSWNRHVISYMKLGADKLKADIASAQAQLNSCLDESNPNGYEHYSDLLEVMEEALCRLES